MLFRSKEYVSNFPLPDTCVIIRKNNKQVNSAFEYCYELMKIYKLKRDQNVYNICMDHYDIIPQLLDQTTLEVLI